MRQSLMEEGLARRFFAGSIWLTSFSWRSPQKSVTNLSQMRLEDLDFQYPEELVATQRAEISRVMLVKNRQPHELSSVAELLDQFQPGDVLVINDTKVLKRRLFTESGLEILFLNAQDSHSWEVLCPASRWKPNQLQTLPDGVTLELMQRGKPQLVRSSVPLNEDYFQKHAELPLPPYIQKARGERHNRSADLKEYQTAWAQSPGSLAAPTASLHFGQKDLEVIESRGAKVLKITLHVGIGTFLPIEVDDLAHHQMHAEHAEISAAVWSEIQQAKEAGGRVWVLGTTVTRALESAAHGLLPKNPRDPGGFFGETNLFITPGHEYRMVDVLCTNFHQPKSTLMALVAAFSDLETVKRCYAWAIDRRFRLFSYGDLSVWMKP